MAVQTKTLCLKDWCLDIEVRCNDEGQVVEVVEDIDKEGFISYDQDDFEENLQPFVDAGVTVEYEPWTVNYDPVDGTPGEWEGWMIIEKEEINKAITDKRLIIETDEDGYLFITGPKPKKNKN